MVIWVGGEVGIEMLIFLENYTSITSRHTDGWTRAWMDKNFTESLKKNPKKG